MVRLAHKIRIYPTNKQKDTLHKLFGIRRVTWNWAVDRQEHYYKNGVKKSWMDLRKEFNEIKYQKFPFIKDAPQAGVQEVFRDFHKAMQGFYKGLRGKPKFHSKYSGDSFYFCPRTTLSKYSDLKNRYIKLTKLGVIKMREIPRYSESKLNSIVLSKKGKHYYASFNYEMSEVQYQNYLKLSQVPYLTDTKTGIDVGIKNPVTLAVGSKGVILQLPKEKTARVMSLLKRQQKKLARKCLKNPDRTSKRYLLQKQKVTKLFSDIKHLSDNFAHQASACIVKNFSDICVENIKASFIGRNRKLSKRKQNVPIGKFLALLEEKTKLKGVSLSKAEKNYPSSKTCSHCGAIKSDLKLSDRHYECEICGFTCDRDLNASFNLRNLLGSSSPEVTDGDMMSLLDSFNKAGLAYNIVEPSNTPNLKNV